MPNMTVPMQAGGAKSLPAELKVGGGRPFMRMRAEHPGYGRRPVSGFAGPWSRGGSAEDIAGLMGLGSDRGPYNPLVLNPIVALARGMHGLGEGDAGSTVEVPIESFPDTTPLPVGGDIMQGLDSITPQIPDWNGPTIAAPTVTPPSPPAGYSWAQVLDSTGKTIGQILAISQGGSVTQLPNGLRIVQGSQPGAVQQASGGLLTGTSAGVTGLLGSNTGLLLIVGLGLFLVLGSRGR